MITLLLTGLLVQTAAANPDETITVTGQRIAREYALCARGGCTPARDANATLAQAEQLLLAGNYKASRAALWGALRRTAGAAKTQPLVVSALYDADSTLALHLGDHVDARRSGLKSVALLRDAYGENDPRAIAARVRSGDVESKVGGPDGIANADRAYAGAVRAARTAGLSMLADAITLRRAYLLASRGQAAAAQAQLARYADDAAAPARLRLQAAVLGARVARDQGDAQTADRLIDHVGRQPAGTKPLLLSAPDIANSAVARAIAGDKWGDDQANAFRPRAGAYQPLRWIDMGFWIRPDGRVEEVEILRGSPVRDWATPVLRAAAARRYAPVDSAAGDPGRYRIERYTLTAEIVKPIDSLIARRAGPPVLRWLDITDDPRRTPTEPAS